MSQHICTKNIPTPLIGDFKDAENFGILEDHVVFVTDCSNWAKVVRNNLRLDDYLNSESIIKTKCDGPIFTDKKNIKPGFREKTSRKGKLEKKLIDIEEDEEDESKWDKRMRCDYCLSLVEVVVSQYSWPNVNYYCDCNKHYFADGTAENGYGGEYGGYDYEELEELFF